MKAYLIDEDQMKILKQVEDFLYNNTALKADYLDKKRDMANLLNYTRYQIERQSLTAD